MLTGFLMLAAAPCAAERPTTDKLTAAATTTMRMNTPPPRMRLVIPVVVLERDRFMRLKSVGDSAKLTLLRKNISGARNSVSVIERQTDGPGTHDILLERTPAAEVTGDTHSTLVGDVID